MPFGTHFSLSCFLRNKHTHTHTQRRGKMSSNTKARHKLYSNRIFRYRPISAYCFEDDTNI